ncbi:MAG: hypothetical protein KBS66_06925 [Eubacterium sp.]|nr:hypothetical protein [Candidatus Colimonas fimequi]
MKKSKLTIALYVVAAIMGLLFLYLFVSSYAYIRSYAISYGMTVGDMGFEAIQYIISNSVAYLVYGVGLFALAQIWEAVRCKTCVAAEAPAEAPAAAVEETEEADDTIEALVAEEAAAEAEGWSMDKVPELYTSKLFM